MLEIFEGEAQIANDLRLERSLELDMAWPPCEIVLLVDGVENLSRVSTVAPIFNTVLLRDVDHFISFTVQQTSSCIWFTANKQAVDGLSLIVNLKTYDVVCT
ncbi:hypothetical protein R5R35_011683 [Gryllus longicercus]|uniref:Uncharacterized protein n=1 Tax=Gryllus longicercus TaxID=2509291 RepID=A0AAN9VUM8_9ORTH